MIFSMVTADPPTTLLKDSFLDGNYTVAEGASGMTWTVLSGGATVSGGQPLTLLLSAISAFPPMSSRFSLMHGLPGVLRAGLYFSIKILPIITGWGWEIRPAFIG